MKHVILSIIGIIAIASSGAAQDIPLSKILVEKDSWREVAKGLPKVTHLDGMPDGGVAVNQNGIHGTLTSNGKFQPGSDTFVLRTAHTALTSKGRSYAIDREGKSVNCFEAGRRVDALKLPGLKAPSCVCLWPDEGHVVIGESDGAYLWAVRIEKDGKFGPGDRYYSLRTRPNEKLPVAAMTMDAGYLLYACTPLGIQVFDPTGRLSGLVAAPSKDVLTAITIGGAKADELFVAAGDKIFARHIQGKASYAVKKEK